MQEVAIQFGETSNRAGGRLWNSLVTQATLDYSHDSQIICNWDLILDVENKLYPRVAIFEESFVEHMKVNDAEQMNLSDGFQTFHSHSTRPRDTNTWWDDCLVKISPSNTMRCPIGKNFSFQQGQEAGVVLETREACLDIVRRITERLNSLSGGFRINCDAFGGWGGFISEIIPAIVDDFSPPTISCLPYFGAPHAKEIVEVAESLVNLYSFSSQLTPISLFSRVSRCSPRQIAAVSELLISPQIYSHALGESGIQLAEFSRFEKILGARLQINTEQFVWINGQDFDVSNKDAAIQIERTLEYPIYSGEDVDAGVCHAVAASLLFDTGSAQNDRKPAILDHIKNEVIWPLSKMPEATEIRESLESIIRY